MMASFMCQSVRLQYSVINLNTNLDVALKVSCGCDQQHHQLTLSKGNWPHNVGGFHIKTLRAKLEASQKRENSVWRLWHQFPPKFPAYQPTHNHLTQFFFQSLPSLFVSKSVNLSLSLSFSTGPGFGEPEGHSKICAFRGSLSLSGERTAQEEFLRSLYYP